MDRLRKATESLFLTELAIPLQPISLRLKHRSKRIIGTIYCPRIFFIRSMTSRG